MDMKGGQTQDEILALDIVKLGLQKNDLFVDIGCGTGKVSFTASKHVKTVYAVDRRSEAISLARVGASEAGITNITFFEEEAVQFLTHTDNLDCAFVGGSQHLEEVLGLLAKKVHRTIVVNAVLIHTADVAISTLKRLGIFKEAILVQVSRSHELGQGVMFRPLDPIYIIIGGF